MTNVLIVYAHEEPQSFNGAMRDVAVNTLEESGCQVVVSDLYAMNFNPVGGKHDFTKTSDAAFFKYAAEQTKATKDNTFAADVADEQTKLLAADLLIFQFPLWWFGMPAILKGWVDRVFAAGLTYGGGRWYNKGVFKGKRAMLSFTTGGGPSIYSPTGLNGDLDAILFPINHGIFYFVGFDVLPPFVAWGPAGASPAVREQYLRDYAERLRQWQNASTIAYRPLEDYDETFQLKAGASPMTSD